MHFRYCDPLPTLTTYIEVFDYCFADFTRCMEGKFHCKNGYCITQSHVCDGEDDCHDFSDESSCRKFRRVA